MQQIFTITVTSKRQGHSPHCYGILVVIIWLIVLRIGVYPDYVRHQDVEFQTKLARPDAKIVYTLSGLADQIKQFSFRP